MNKSKFFVIIAVLALIILSLCACSDSKPALSETNQSMTETTVAANTAETQNEDVTDKVSDSTQSSEEVSQGENDLVIITVPQEDVKASENTSVTDAVTEALSETEEATEPSTTEVKKIELPFVPAN